MTKYCEKLGITLRALWDEIKKLLTCPIIVNTFLRTGHTVFYQTNFWNLYVLFLRKDILELK